MVLETLKEARDILVCGTAGLVTGVAGGLYIPFVIAAQPINLAVKIAIVRGKGEQFDTTTRIGEFLDTSIKREEASLDGPTTFSEGIRFQKLLYNAFRDAVYGKEHADPNDTCNQVSEISAAFGSVAGFGAGFLVAGAVVIGLGSLALPATLASSPMVPGLLLGMPYGVTGYIRYALEKSEGGLSYSNLPPAKKEGGALAPSP